MVDALYMKNMYIECIYILSYIYICTLMILSCIQKKTNEHNICINLQWRGIYSIPIVVFVRSFCNMYFAAPPKPENRFQWNFQRI